MKMAEKNEKGRKRNRKIEFMIPEILFAILSSFRPNDTPRLIWDSTPEPFTLSDTPSPERFEKRAPQWQPSSGMLRVCFRLVKVCSGHGVEGIVVDERLAQ